MPSGISPRLQQRAIVRRRSDQLVRSIEQCQRQRRDVVRVGGFHVVLCPQIRHRAPAPAKGGTAGAAKSPKEIH